MARVRIRVRVRGEGGKERVSTGCTQLTTMNGVSHQKAQIPSLSVLEPHALMNAQQNWNRARCGQPALSYRN